MNDERPDPGYTVLTGQERVTYGNRKREASQMWRDVVRGQKVFIAGMKPSQLPYWYRKGKASNIDITMRQATVNGVEGTVIERKFRGND